MGYVYKITNTINNKAYIGISIHEPEKRRIREHLSGHGNRIIANAIKKYGPDAFTYEILEANVFDEFLPELEVAYISNYNTVAPHGYNLNSGGSHAIPSEETCRKMSKNNSGEKNPNFGKSHSAETRRKMSKAQKGENNPQFGKTPSAETRHKLSESMKGEKNHFFGKTHSAETRRKLSERQKGKKNHNFGKPLSELTRRKISEAQKGRTFSEEHRRRLSEANKNPSAQTRRKMSEAHKGKVLSAKHRRNISESMKGEKNHNFGKSPSKETRRKISESNTGLHKGEKNPNFGKKHSESTRRKISNALMHPDKAAVREYFFSLRTDMPLMEKRKLLCTKFRDVSESTIRRWVRKWSS